VNEAAKTAVPRRFPYDLYSEREGRVLTLAQTGIKYAA